MTKKFTEDDVHERPYEVGLEATIAPCAEIDNFDPVATYEDFELWRIVKARALRKLKQLHQTSVWSYMVTSPVEVAFTHNFGFRPVGMFREAYSSFLNNLYAREANGTDDGEDVSMLKINELTNWTRAWMFMEGCGFAAGELPGDEGDYFEDNDPADGEH